MYRYGVTFGLCVLFPVESTTDAPGPSCRKVQPSVGSDAKCNSHPQAPPTIDRTTCSLGVKVCNGQASSVCEA